MSLYEWLQNGAPRQIAPRLALSITQPTLKQATRYSCGVRICKREASVKSGGGFFCQAENGLHIAATHLGSRNH